jgi:hypothetical protein
MPKNDPEYMRKYQADRRAAQKEGVQRSLGNEVIVPGEYEAGHIHEWLRRIGEDTAKCEGCDEIVKWQGKLLNRHTDGLPDTSELIRQMDTKEIDKILNHPAVSTKRGSRE